MADRERIKGAIARINKVHAKVSSVQREELDYALAELNSVLNSPAMQQDIPARELRRRFAAYAMQGYIASTAEPLNERGEPDTSLENFARLAFAMADAMIFEERMTAEQRELRRYLATGESDDSEDDERPTRVTVADLLSNCMNPTMGTIDFDMVADTYPHGIIVEKRS